MHISYGQGFKGKVEAFISAQELKGRKPEPLEQEPFLMIAQHTRNINYDANNTRTLNALRGSLEYLVQKIVPLLVQSNSRNRNAIKHFLENRVTAIKREYCVQCVFVPEEVVKLLRVEMLLGVAGEEEGLWHEYLGLSEVLSQQVQWQLSSYTAQYDEILIYAIFCTKKSGLPWLLSLHSRIMESPALAELFELRLKMDKGNIEAYIEALNNVQTLVRVILIRQLKEMRHRVAERIAKAFRDIPTSCVQRLLLSPIQVSPEETLLAKDVPSLFPKLPTMEWGGMRECDLMALVQGITWQ